MQTIERILFVITVAAMLIGWAVFTALGVYVHGADKAAPYGVIAIAITAVAGTLGTVLMLLRTRVRR
jgi:membrane protein YdbS with pleckstrin-like domain